MKVLNYSHGADIGGQGIRIKWAFDNHSDWFYRQTAGKTNYLEYPVDYEPAERCKPETFDVLHANAWFHKRLPVMPSVIHYHGTAFRKRPKIFLGHQRDRRAFGLAATLDLWLLAPEKLEWLPAPYDLEWLSTFRQPQDGPLRVGHAPTDRTVKSTERFLEACAQMDDVEVVLIEKTDWSTCLKRKGTVDVFYDQVLLGYGNNAVEAWGMGIPVIAGGQPDTLAEMRNRFGELPFYEATEDTIGDAVEALRDPVVRDEWGERGRVHAQVFHAEEPVVRMLEGFYLSAVEQFG